MKLNKTQTQKSNNTLFMNLSKKIAATALMFIAFVSVSNAQMSAEQTVSATAIIIQPISLRVDAHLEFGNIIPKNTGTVRITPAGVVSEIGAEIAQGQKGRQAAAAFTVQGEPENFYTITLPADEVVFLTREGTTGANNTMAINDFKHSINGTPQVGPNGSQSFNVGATLSVAQNQPAGIYKGQFTVKVEYN
jgi:hypothetical protein